MRNCKVLLGAGETRQNECGHPNRDVDDAIGRRVTDVKNLSAQQTPEEERAWLPQKNGDKKRAQSACAQKGTRQSAPDLLIFCRSTPDLATALRCGLYLYLERSGKNAPYDAADNEY